MADTMRWRYGETNPVVMPVDADTVIEIGDLVYLENDLLWPASIQEDAGTTAANQEIFHDNFVGVAMQRSRAGESNPVRVATSGVFEFAVVNGQYEVGLLMGVAAAGGGGLDNQSVINVATPNLAIGRCAKWVNPENTVVLVDIVSTRCKGGPQAAA